jgi:hypothetical protein
MDTIWINEVEIREAGTLCYLAKTNITYHDWPLLHLMIQPGGNLEEV